MRRLFLLGCALISLSAPVLADVPPPGGQVTISLSEFMKLTHPAQVQRPTAPMPYILASGDYRISSEAKWVQVDGTISLRLYQGGWVEVPLMATGPVMTSATLDGKSLPLFQKDEKYCFMASGVGDHVVKIRYHLPLSASGATQAFTMKLPETSVSTTTLIVPEKDVRVTASPSVPLTSDVRSGKTVVQASMPESGEVTFSWTPEHANPLLIGKKTHEKPVLQARTFALVTVSDKVIRTHYRINCAILRNETSSLVFDVPAGQEVVDVQCQHLATWNAKDVTGGKQVTVALSEPVAGQELVDIIIEKGVDSVNGTWEVPTLALEGAERVKGSIGVEATGGIEVTLADKHDIRGIDVKELPAEVTSMASSPLVLAYEYHKEPFHLSIESQKGEEMAVLTATIDTAEGLTLVTPEGKMVTRMSYSIRNNLKQNLTLKLPEGATIWSAYVNGEPVKPIKASDGQIKVPLLRSAGNGNGMETFPAEITYVTDGAATTMWGQRTMVAPECDVPISQMNWSVFMPKDCKIMRFGGTMQEGETPVLAATGVGQGAPVARPEPVLDYRERDGANNGPAASRAAVGGKLKDDEDTKTLNQMVNTARQGAFPVRVYVPEVGQAYHFSSLMVAHQMPSIVVYYSTGRLEAAIGGGIFLSFLLGGAAMARRYHWAARLADLRPRVKPIEPLPVA